MRGALRQVGALALALLLVTTAALSGVGGPASPVSTAAAEWSDDCSASDSLVGSLIRTFTGGDGCYWVSTNSDYENMSATDGYASALGVKDSTDSYTTTTGNFMENSRSVAYSKAKIQVVNDLNNGTSVSVAKNNVNQTVENYYSRVEREAVTDYNAKMENLYYIIENTGMEHRVIKYFDASQTSGESSTDSASEYNGYVSGGVNYTLINGTEMDLKTFSYSGGGAGLSDEDASVTILTGTPTSVYTAEIQAKDPSSGTWTTVLDTTDYGNYETDGILDRAESQSTQVKQNMAPYVEEVYAQYQAGEINSTDLAMNDPSVIANEASTSLDSTGYYGHASIMLASLGAGGDTNVSHTVETSDGTVMNGTLFYTAQDAPETGWATNQTYNVSDYNGTFYFAVQKDDGAGIVDLSNYGETFTLTSATNTRTGESVNTTEIHRYTYDSTNASALAEEIDRLEELRAEYEAQSNNGGGGWGGIGTEDKGLIALVALAAILLVTRN